MESETNKLFVGGITHDTNVENLREYFSKFGEVKNAQVMRNRVTGVSRGFGFVSFTDQSSMEKALQNEEHRILGRRVAVNIPRPIEKKPMREDHINQSSSPLRVNKIFVGGLPPNLTKEEFDRYFETFGTIIDSVIMCNKQNNSPRGFGFVTYESDESIQKVMTDRFHRLGNKWVDVKRAIPRGEEPAKFYGHDYYQCLWGYGPSGPYFSYPLYTPSTFGYYIYGAYPNQMGAPNTHVQQVWVNDPNFVLYPIRQMGISYVDATYMDHHASEVSGTLRDQRSNVIAHRDSFTEAASNHETPEAIENGIPGAPSNEITKDIVNGNGVVNGHCSDDLVSTRFPSSVDAKQKDCLIV